MSVLFENVKSIIQVRTSMDKVLKGRQMADLPTLENAWLFIQDGLIVDCGLMADGVSGEASKADQVVDCTNRFVFPSWVDSHTHIVYAGNREGEFVDRIKGRSYAEIAESGGGILNSAKRLSSASEEELFDAAWGRLDEVMHQGTGLIEIKSGYGLTVASELKMLRVIKALNEKHPLPIKATLLGAHALPEEFKNNKSGYIDLVVNEMIPRVADEGLASYIDIFCEEGYFDVADTNRVLEAGVKHGLKPKTHVNQFTVIGGVEASIKHGAISVDHLEELSDADIQALQNSSTIPVGLPLCSLFLSIPYTPARALIAAGLPFALATDYNPGSSPSGNMNLAVALACSKMKLTPDEAINAATLNGAAALEESDNYGSITKGKRANFFITKAIPSYAFLPYSFGANHIDQVWIEGKRQ